MEQKNCEFYILGNGNCTMAKLKLNRDIHCGDFDCSKYFPDPIVMGTEEEMNTGINSRLVQFLQGGSH